MADPEPCAHLLGAPEGPAPFEELLALSDAEGQSGAVVACRACGETALLELIDWGAASREERFYRLSGIPRALVHEYLARGGRASCDVGRPGRELEAFLSRAGPPRGLVVWNLPERRIRAVHRTPAR